MALRILQLGVVFTIGFHCGLAQPISGAGDAGVKPIPLSVHLKDPQDVTVVRRQPATLHCDYHANNRSIKSLKIKWYHNNKVVSPDDPRRLLQSDGSLYIPKVTAGRKGSSGLTGDYKCQAVTSVGSIISNAAKLQVADWNKDFEENPEDQTVILGQPAVFHCKIHSVPAAVIQWVHNDLPLPHNSKFVPLPSGSLLITDTNSSDEGSYRCIAKNSMLNKTAYSDLGSLTVVSPSGNPEPPSFLPLNITLKTTVLLGEDVTLYCAVTGWPIPKIDWLYNNYVVGNSSVLNIHAADVNSAGKYICVVTNSQGHINQTQTLEVQQKPFFNVTPTSQIYPSAITVRLECQSIGVPEPTVYWLKDSEPLAIKGRIKWQPNGHGLIFSHTFTFDSGIYQCVAENAAGKVWAAAELILMQQTPTSPPENLQCRSYDETSICLTWRAPANVTAQAYIVYPFYLSKVPSESNYSLVEIASPEYLVDRPYTLATGLQRSTNYTFYVRLYSKKASDNSNSVTCQTGVKGKRSLHIEAASNNSVQLSWSQISTDISCNGTEGVYQVKWRRRGLIPFSREDTKNFSHVVHGLIPKTQYEFSVDSSVYQFNTTWMPFVMPSNFGSPESVNLNDSVIVPIAPENLQPSKLSANSIILSWTDQNANIDFYIVCYIEVGQHESCEGGEVLTSSKTYLEVKNLKSNTLYEFQVQSHNSENVYGPFSEPLQIRTPFDVPSPVLNLNYTIVNETSVCIFWKAPEYSHLKITEYIISYTPNDKWELVSIPANKTNTKECNAYYSGQISSLLTNLKSEEKYTLFVRGVSDAGVGQPVIPIEISTNKAFTSLQNKPNWQPQFDYVHIIGLVLGIVLILICILVFVSIRVISIKRRRRLNARTRRLPTHSYCPAVAHYATQSSSVQVRLEEPADLHEIEHLVEETPVTNIPPVNPIHLDTKGGNDFPNGHINGSSKPSSNGYIPNGYVHITENPQYYAVEPECNGRQQESYKPQYEDPNSNLQTSKFRDLQRLFESSKKVPKYQQCNPHFANSVSHNQDNLVDEGNNESTYNLTSSFDDSDVQESLNSTQMTNLNDSVRSRRRLSPILGPNG